MLLDTRADASPTRGADVRDHGGAGQDLEDAPIADELLVEEVSIDGMCGVY